MAQLDLTLIGPDYTNKEINRLAREWADRQFTDYYSFPPIEVNYP